MRSEIECVDEWIDLPSLTQFKGNIIFYYIGSVILESMDLVFDWCRYPSINIRWNQIRCLLLRFHLFPPILKYSYFHFLIIRCYWFRELPQLWKTGTNCIKYRYKKPNRAEFNSVGCGRSMDKSLRCFRYVRVITEQIPVTEDSSDWQWTILVGKHTRIEQSPFSSIHWYWLCVFPLCSILLIDWFDWWIGMNSQIFLNYNQSNLVTMHSIMFNRLHLRVIEWRDWWFRFA